MAGETLKITGGNAAGQDINLEQELVIGRSTPGLGSLEGDTEISRAHARVFHDPSGRLMIEDLGSTNGTFVNGTRIAAQQALNPGDEVRVGQTTMSVAGGDPGATTVGNVVPAPVPVPPQEPPTQALPPQQPAYAQQPAYGQQPPPPPAGGPIGGPPQRSGGGPSRNLLIALAAALVLVLVVAGLAIGGVFSGSDDKKSDTTAQTTSTPTQTSPTVAMPEPPTTDTTPAPSSGSYPPGFRKKFVDSCESGGAPRNICGCTFDKLKARYTFPEFVALLGKVKGSNLPGPVRDAVQQCARS
jgi:FHA domain